MTIFAGIALAVILATLKQSHPLKTPGRGERKRTHCKQGHFFDEENTILIPKGRRCRACLRNWKGWQGGVHNREKTHCPRGHEYTSENTYLNPSTGGRHCQACTRERHNSRAETSVSLVDGAIQLPDQLAQNHLANEPQSASPATLPKNSRAAS